MYGVRNELLEVDNALTPDEGDSEGDEEAARRIAEPILYKGTSTSKRPLYLE